MLEKSVLVLEHPSAFIARNCLFLLSLAFHLGLVLLYCVTWFILLFLLLSPIRLLYLLFLVMSRTVQMLLKRSYIWKSDIAVTETEFGSVRRHFKMPNERGMLVECLVAICTVAVFCNFSVILKDIVPLAALATSTALLHADLRSGRGRRMDTTWVTLVTQVMFPSLAMLFEVKLLAESQAAIAVPFELSVMMQSFGIAREEAAWAEPGWGAANVGY